MKKEKRAIQIVVNQSVHKELAQRALNADVSLKKYVEILCIAHTLEGTILTKQ